MIVLNRWQCLYPTTMFYFFKKKGKWCVLWWVSSDNSNSLIGGEHELGNYCLNEIQAEISNLQKLSKFHKKLLHGFQKIISVFSIKISKQEIEVFRSTFCYWLIKCPRFFFNYPLFNNPLQPNQPQPIIFSRSRHFNFLHRLHTRSFQIYVRYKCQELRVLCVSHVVKELRCWVAFQLICIFNKIRKITIRNHNKNVYIVVQLIKFTPKRCCGSVCRLRWINDLKLHNLIETLFPAIKNFTIVSLFFFIASRC